MVATEMGRLGTVVWAAFTGALVERIRATGVAGIDPVTAALALVAMIERANYYVLTGQVAGARRHAAGHARPRHPRGDLRAPDRVPETARVATRYRREADVGRRDLGRRRGELAHRDEALRGALRTRCSFAPNGPLFTANWNVTVPGGVRDRGLRPAEVAVAGTGLVALVGTLVGADVLRPRREALAHHGHHLTVGQAGRRRDRDRLLPAPWWWSTCSSVFVSARTCSRRCSRTPRARASPRPSTQRRQSVPVSSCSPSAARRADRFPIQVPDPAAVSPVTGAPASCGPVTCR